MLPTEAFDWISSQIGHNQKILEFGSGEGTHQLIDDYQVYSIEHDSVWVEKAPSYCHHVPIQENPTSDSLGEKGWYEIEKVLDIINDEFALIIIDGPPGTIGRNGILEILDKLPKTNYLVDDVHREAELRLLHSLESHFGCKSSIHESYYENGKPRQWATLQLEA
tara:strand:+ start:101 stop:595 length:495 start_codon:yes stop_codon:yes gene_type:complete